MMPLVKEGSGVLNDACAQVLGLYVMLGVKNSDCRMARQATGVGAASGESVCLCVRERVFVLCLRASDRV